MHRRHEVGTPELRSALALDAQNGAPERVPTAMFVTGLSPGSLVYDV